MSDRLSRFFRDVLDERGWLRPTDAQHAEALAEAQRRLDKAKATEAPAVSPPILGQQRSLLGGGR